MAGQVASGSRHIPLLAHQSRSARPTRRHVATRAAVIEKAAMLGGVQRPDADGRFGKYGGKYVPETLIPALLELETEYRAAMADPAFLVRREWPRGAHVPPRALLSAS